MRLLRAHPLSIGVSAVVIIGIAIAAILQSSGEELSCTAVGCTQGIEVNTARERDVAAVRVCSGGQCETELLGCERRACTANFYSQIPPTPRQEGQLTRVAVTFLTSDGKPVRRWSGERRYSKTYPNGAACGDPCFLIRLSI